MGGKHNEETRDTNVPEFTKDNNPRIQETQHIPNTVTKEQLILDIL